MQHKNPKGISLIEIVIALGIFTLSIGAILNLLNQNFYNIASVRGNSQAQALAEEGIEASRIIRDRSWTELTTGDHGLSFSNNSWVFNGISDSQNGFNRTITVSELATNEKQVVSNVSWQPSPLRTLTTTLTTVITNWRNLVPTRLSGNWRNPQTLGTIDLGAGNSGNSLVVNNGIVYMAASASDSKKDDFYIINATDGVHPFINGSLNTGTGLNAVAVSGNYSYVANSNSNYQLQIIDVSNSSSPTLTSSLKLTGNNEEGSSIAVSENYVYIGTEKSDGTEFFVVNVSNPNSPTISGSLEIGDDVGDIFVFGDRVFLATAKDTQEFIVVNATNPAAPTKVTAVDILGNSEDGRGLYVNDQDNHAYIVRSVGGNHADHPELAVIDVSNPDTPTYLGSLNYPADINGIVAADNLAFLATSYPSEEFKIYETTNPANLSYYAGLNFPQVATDIALENNIIYVSVRSNDALRIITSQ